MAAGKCFIIVGGWLELLSMQRVSLLGFLYGQQVPSVRFRVTSRKLQIFQVCASRNVQTLFLKFSCDVLLVGSDCGPLRFLRSTSPWSLQSPTLFLPYFSLRLFRRKSDASMCLVFATPYQSKEVRNTATYLMAGAKFCFRPVSISCSKFYNKTM